MIRSLCALPAVVALMLVTSLGGPGTAAADPLPWVGSAFGAAPAPVVVDVTGPGVAAAPTWVVRTRTPADADRVLRDVGATPTATFGGAAGFTAASVSGPVVGGVAGFAAALSPTQLAAVRLHAGVLGLEPDLTVTPLEPRTLRLSAPPAPQANWGLERIDQRFLPLDGRPRTRATGAGVTIYVLDTGVDTTHPEFGGRAQVGANLVDDRSGDCDGHGTVVAGIAASRLHGVAPGAQVRSVKVLDCNGVARLSSLLAGIDWVARHAQRPAVAVMSWSFGASDTLAAAVRGLVDGGVFVAASAGNTGTDDCAALPRAVPGVLVVASSTRDDQRAPTSSTGPCVDLYAPGASIVSTVPGGGTDSWSGTSMAAPHAAGVAALYKQVYGDAPSAVVKKWIVDHATPGVVQDGAVGDTPDRLLYDGDL